MKNIFFASVLILVAVLGRTLIYLGPNIEFITVTTLLAGVYLPKKYSIIVPLFSVFISDFFLKNSFIFVFTWSAWIMIGCSSLLLKFLIRKFSRTIILSTGWAALTSVFFFLWTNFGVWFQGWYPPTLNGLVTSYYMGLPFLKNNLLSNMFLVPTGFLLYSLLKNNYFILTKLSLKKN